MCGPLLYYKRVDPYLCSELAPVLEGSGSRGRYPQKGTSVDRVSVVFVARVDHRIFLLFAKNEFVVEVRSLKVTARHLNNPGCCYEYTIVSMTRIARRYTISATCQAHIRCTLNWMAAGRQAGRQGRMEDGREGARGGQGTRGRE